MDLKCHEEKKKKRLIYYPSEIIFLLKDDSRTGSKRPLRQYLLFVVRDKEYMPVMVVTWTYLRVFFLFVFS